MGEEKKVMLSGIQPSGDLHLGNYLGAIKNWADRVNDYDCYYFMADMHTITVRQDRSQGAAPPLSGDAGDLYCLRP